MIDKQINDYYSKLPNELFYVSNKNLSLDPNKKSILVNTQINNKFNYKAFFILDYLYMNTNRRNIITFYLKDMIKDCGFKYNPRKGESCDQFKYVLSELQKNKVISSLVNLSDIKSSDRVSCTLDIDLNSEYFMLYDNEKNKILSQTIDKTTENKMLLVYYCYLKSRIYKRSANDDIDVNGGRAEVGFPSFNLIHSDLGIADDTIDKYNKILVELDLIRYDSAENWYYKNDPNKVTHNSCNIYTLFTDEETAKYNLKEGIKFYKSLDINSDKVFTNSKEYKNNNKRLNGELGSIIKKEIHNTATDKDLIRKNEILSSIHANEDEYKIKALLESNEGELLSDIYFGLNVDKVDKYTELEESLGVVDTEGNLLVDYDYYKWVMVTHASGQYEDDYLINCVNKHKREILSVEEKCKLKGLQNKKSIKPEEESTDEWGEILDSFQFDGDDDELFEKLLG